MARARAALGALAALPLLAGAAAAVQPGEMLADPALEARARAISRELRCLVCRNESIDESNAPLARDLRLLVRERISAGASDAEVLAFVTDRYGEYVRLRPAFGGLNALLWLAGPVLLGAGLLLALAFLRRQGRRAEAPALTADEEARLARILEEKE